MIDRCFNPDCRRELHYLRDGRVVRVIMGTEPSQTTEHFWLCGPCYEEYDFVLHPGGKVSIEVKPHGECSTDFFFADVTLPEMEHPPRPVARDKARQKVA